MVVGMLVTKWGRWQLSVFDFPFLGLMIRTDMNLGPRSRISQLNCRSSWYLYSVMQWTDPFKMTSFEIANEKPANREDRRPPVYAISGVYSRVGQILIYLIVFIKAFHFFSVCACMNTSKTNLQNYMCMLIIAKSCNTVSSPIKQLDIEITYEVVFLRVDFLPTLRKCCFSLIWNNFLLCKGPCIIRCWNNGLNLYKYLRIYPLY